MRPIDLRRGDALAILLIIVILGILVIMALGGDWILSPNSGFGPHWDCTYPGEGDPVCAKSPASPAQRRAPSQSAAAARG